MSLNDDRARLMHSLDHAAEAISLIAGRRREDLDTDRLLNLSLVRLMEIAAQSAARVSDETRQANPQVPWAELAGLRDRLLHGYDTVDLDILWTIVHDDLPPLVEQFRVIAEHLPPTGSKGDRHDFPP
jgi:uncharacterized protein with HEPN domain